MEITNTDFNFTNEILKLATSQQLTITKKFIKFCDGSLDITKLNNFKNQLLNEGLKPSSVKIHLYRLKGLFSKAIDTFPNLTNYEKVIIQQELKNVKVPQQNTPAISPENCLNKQEVKLLVESLPPSVAHVASFLAITGCRVSEALAIKITDCEKDDDVVEIQILGKGHKYRKVLVDTAYFESINKGKRLLFETSNGKPISRQYITCTIQKKGYALFLKRISAHTLRHSFATCKIEETNKIQAVSRYLGHSSCSTTLDMYTHQHLSKEELLGNTKRR